jgi:hypothetical protein
MDFLDGLFEFAGAIAVKVSEWKVTRQVRGRMGKSLGKTPSDLELASLKTWMKVEEREQEQGGNPIHPK